MTAEPESDPCTLRLVTASASETRALGRAIGKAALPLGRAGVLLGLHGDLGAGKTVLVQGVAEGFGVDPAVLVVSPTFTIARSYPVPGRGTLHHVDAYRLDGGEDLEQVGFEEMCGSGCLTCVEWSARVEDALPADRIEAWIEPLPPTDPPEPGEVPVLERRIRLLAHGPAARRALARLAVTTAAHADPRAPRP